MLNELLGKANNVNEDWNFNDIEISLDEGKPELRPVFINSTVKDVEDIDISKEDEDLFKSSDSFNESGSQVDYIKKLLNHWNKNYQYGKFPYEQVNNKVNRWFKQHRICS